MTQVAIKKQIADIKKATANATKSRRAALNFLEQAGILQTLTKANTTTTPKKRK